MMVRNFTKIVYIIWSGTFGRYCGQSLVFSIVAIMIFFIGYLFGKIHSGETFHHLNKLHMHNAISSATSVQKKTDLQFSKWNISHALQIIERMGQQIRALHEKNGIDFHTCPIWLAGISKVDNNTYGAHAICNYPPSKRNKKFCLFYSFGIGKNYQFDLDLANEWNCQGVAFDPNVQYEAKIHPNITFHMIAARTLSEENDRRWPLVSTVPKIQKSFSHITIDVLKMDCEGCEYSLARDIEEENPNFFDNIDQFATEIHVAKYWINSEMHLLNMGKLFLLLEQAGLRLMHASMSGLGYESKNLQCPQEILDIKYPCDRNTQLHNLLFARMKNKQAVL